MSVSTNVVIFLAAMLPSVVLMGITMWRDRKQPEPLRLLAKGFFFGVVSTVVSLVFTIPATKNGLIPETANTPLEALWTAFAGAAFPEEMAKLLMLWLLLRNNKYFDEYFDGVVYAVSVGLGFAAFENVGYLFESGDRGEWISTAIVRGLLSVPAHYSFAVLMGYYYSLVHFGQGGWYHRIMILFAPVLAHGIFDALIMVGAVDEVSELTQTLMFITALWFCYQLRKISRNRIAALQQQDNYCRDEGHYRDVWDIKQHQ